MSLTLRIRAVGALVGTAVAAAALGACGGGSSERATTSGPRDGTALAVVASIYPLEYIAERVGGDQVTVANLTPPGAEPHEVELSPRDVAAVHDADLVVYLAGFSPAVDDAVATVAGDASFDVGPSARLDLPAPSGDAGGDQGDSGPTDLHFWLDPTRLGDVASQLAVELGRRDPEHTETFVANAAALARDLHALDAELAAGLSTCQNRTLVTSHAAFGYLAERYGLEQLGISGLTPEEEPTPQSLAAAADFVQQHDVATIYYETLVSPSIAETVAAETGAKVEVLDPLEGLSDEAQAQGRDYLAVMRANLASLQRGQPCP